MDPPGHVSDPSGVSRPRRVVSTPLSVPAPSQRPQSPSSQTAASQSEELVETLYSHPAVRIISFTSSHRGFATSLPGSSDNGVPPGSLPPSSQLERTIAVGAFRIYRAPGSVAFLSCGSALQPILPKSQCWCINEDNSRFVLQIRRPQYWRIEVPTAGSDDAHRAVLLRDVFDKILLFEKTECPFQRDFIVRLPSPPETPVKKRAWTAEGKNLISSPFQADLSPPAHAPMTISRGERATSISFEYSLLGAEPRMVGRAQDKYSWEATDQSSAGVHEGNDAFRGIHLVRHRTLSHEKLSEGSAAASPATSSSPGPELLQRPRVLTPDSSVGETETYHGHSGAHSIDPSRLNLTNGWLAAGEDGNDDGARRIYYLEEYEGGVNARVLEIEDELESAKSHDQGVRKSLGGNGVNETVAHLSGNVITDTQQECPVSDENGDADILKLDRSMGEDDPALFEGSGRVAPIDLARKRRTRMLAERSFTTFLPDATVLSSPLRSNAPATVAKTSPPRPPQYSIESRSSSASTDAFHSSVTPPLPSSRPGSPGLERPSAEAENAEPPKLPSLATCSPNHATGSKSVMNVVPGALVVSDNYDNKDSIGRPTRNTTDDISEVNTNGQDTPDSSRLSMFKDKPQGRPRSHTNSLSISHRTLSPLPPAVNLLSPPRQAPEGHPAAVRRLPSTIVQKTIELLLGPPVYLVKLMLRVAAKIAGGEWRGLVLGYGETGEQIPVEWDYYSDGEFSDLSDSDDHPLTAYGSTPANSVPRTGIRRRARYTHNNNHNSWEVD